MAAQEATEVVVDDPAGALGDSRPAVEQAAGRLGVFVVSVVPSLAGQPVEEVVAQRFAQLAPTGSPYDVLLLVVLDERLAVFGVRDPATVLTELGDAAAEAFEQLQVASSAATESFASGDAGAAALAGLTAVERALDGDEGSGGRDVDGKEVLTWVIAAFALLGLVRVGRDVSRRWQRRRDLGRTGVGDVRWEEPGRAPSAVPALLAGLSGTVIPVVVPAALAWWLGRSAWREIASSGGQLGGRGFAVAAFVLAGYSLFATVALVASGLS